MLLLLRVRTKVSDPIIANNKAMIGSDDKINLIYIGGDS